MFPYLIPMKAQIDAAPPVITRNDVAKLGKKTDTATRSLYALQQAQGTAAKDLGVAKVAIQARTERLVTQVASDALVKLGLVDTQLRQHVTSEVARVGQAIELSLLSSNDKIVDLQKASDRQQMLSFVNDALHVQLGYALSDGNVLFTLDAEAEDVSAAELNAAASGTFKKTFSCALSYTDPGDASIHTHEWASMEPVVTPAEAVTDPEVGVPTVEWSSDPTKDPRFLSGVVELVVTFDTDAGATKTYVAGDAVSVGIQVSASDKWLTYDVVAVTKTYNVIA